MEKLAENLALNNDSYAEVVMRMEDGVSGIYQKVQTPAFVINVDFLEENLKILKSIKEKHGVRILLAQKAFSGYAVYENIMNYLDGTTASGLYEARLAKKYAGSGASKDTSDSKNTSTSKNTSDSKASCDSKSASEIHVYSPAFSTADLLEIFAIADHIVFNSWSQLVKAKELALKLNKQISMGLRINPEFSTGKVEMYDPCAEGSRLGLNFAEFLYGVEKGYVAYLDGLHFHTLCEQGSLDLKNTWDAFKQNFAAYLPQLKWLNLGGGHHLTHPAYDLQLLSEIFLDMRQYLAPDALIYLEPGEAIALNSGFLVSEVKDVLKTAFAGEKHNIILDMSPTCHTPDVIEMPYQPYIKPLYLPLNAERKEDIERFSLPFVGTDYWQQRLNANAIEVGKVAGSASQDNLTDKFIYRLGGPSCLAGDSMGDYSFSQPLYPFDRLIMGDMAIYSMVKTNTFNGIPLPNIYYLTKKAEASSLLRENALSCEQIGEYKLYHWKEFTYDEFERRL